MNKYGEWNTGNRYPRKELLMPHEDLLNALQLRIALSPYSKLELTKNCPRGSRELDELEIVILAILGMGKCMTEDQLWSYLLLKGYAAERDVVMERLIRFVEEGMVVQAAFRKCENDREPQVRTYRVAYIVCNLLQKLGAPFPDAREDYIAGSQMGRYMATSSCLIWNQVIINQLYYNNEVGTFRIKEAVRIGRKQSAAIPLGIYVKGRYCIFDILRSHHDPEKIREHMKMWENFAQDKEKSFVLVLLCESPEHEQWVAGAVAGFSSEWISLATCTEDRWLRAAPGTVTLRGVVL